MYRKEYKYKNGYTIIADEALGIISDFYEDTHYGKVQGFYLYYKGKHLGTYGSYDKAREAMEKHKAEK